MGAAGRVKGAAMEQECKYLRDRIEQLERELDAERENNAAELELRLQTQTDLRYARSVIAAEKALADRLVHGAIDENTWDNAVAAYRKARGL